MIPVGKIWSMLMQTYERWDRHEAPRLGAALAFYTLLSLAPLMIVLVAIAALVFGDTSQAQIMGQVQGMVGKEGAEAIQAMITSAREPAEGTFGSLLGIITLLFGASGVFNELRASLNKAWDVSAHAANGIWGLIRERFLSFGMVLAVGFLLLVSLAASAFIAAVGKFFSGFLPFSESVLFTINIVFSFVSISILFALIYKFIPEVPIRTQDVIVGAVVTAFMFTLGKMLIGLYLGKAAPGSAYGAAGSLVVVILWVYYSAQIFFFGAEFTQVYAHTYGSRAKGAPEQQSVK